MQEETPRFGSIPPSPTEKFLIKLRAVFRRLMARRATRLAIVAIGAVLAVLIIWGAILIARPSPETLDGFIARWNDAVEQNDDIAYDALMQKTLIDTNSAAWNRGFQLLQALHGDGVVLEPLEADVDPEAVTIPVRAQHEEDSETARLALDWEGSEVLFHLERGGWGRKWSVADIHASAPLVKEAQPLEVITEPVEPMTVDLDNGPVEPVAYMTPENTPLDTELKLKQILEAWRTAWENGDVDRYMNWYAEYATIVRVTVVDGREIPETLTIEELSARMRRLARKYDKVEVGISNLQISGTYAEADLNFRQEYAAYRQDNGRSVTAYEDIGIKTLKFVNVDDNWRIYEETWSTYVNVPSYPLN